MADKTPKLKLLKERLRLLKEVEVAVV